MSLLQGAHGRERNARARLILDLVELQQVCRPSRSWVTREEWVSVWSRDRDWNGAWEIAKRAVMRAAQLLRELARVELRMETPEGEGTRIHVDTPDLVALLEPDLQEAREIDERTTARREKRPAEDLAYRPEPSEMVADLRNKKFTLSAIARKNRMQFRAARRVMVAAKQPIPPRGRRPIELLRSADVVARALRLADAGASVSALARELRCTRTSVLRFLKRHGRERSSGHEQRPDEG